MIALQRQVLEGEHTRRRREEEADAARWAALESFWLAMEAGLIEPGHYELRQDPETGSCEVVSLV